MHRSLWLVLFAVACSSTPQAPPDPCSIGKLPDEGAALMEAVERLLIECPDVQLETVVVAEGAVDAGFRGAMTLGEEGRSSVRFEGEFMGMPHQMEFASDGEQLRGTTTVGPLDEPTPAELRKALAIGWTRMGVLHNIARLTGGQGPDHAAGGVDTWVQVDRVEIGEAGSIDDKAALPLNFTIFVEGEEVGAAVLWLDAESGLPLKREQAVQFPTGEMRVTEGYRVTLG